MGSVALHAGCHCHQYQITSYADQTFSKSYWLICQIEYLKQVIFLVGGLLQRITGWMPLSSISDHVFCWSNAPIKYAEPPPAKLLSYAPILTTTPKWTTRNTGFARAWERHQSEKSATMSKFRFYHNLVSQNQISSVYQFQIWMSHCDVIFERWFLTPVRVTFLWGWSMGVWGEEGKPATRKTFSRFHY